jgi:hypothetical protein
MQGKGGESEAIKGESSWYEDSVKDISSPQLDMCSQDKDATSMCSQAEDKS